MNLDEFDGNTRERLEKALNQLQTATLLVSALETELFEAGQTIQDLSRVIERLVMQPEPALPQTFEGQST
jgi:exonuclease VII small subunit